MGGIEGQGDKERYAIPDATMAIVLVCMSQVGENESYHIDAAHEKGHVA